LISRVEPANAGYNPARPRRHVRRTTTIYALFFFIAHHQAGVSAVAFAIAALIAIPLARFRRPLAASGAVIAALVVSIGNGVFGGGLADALVYRHGLTGEAMTVGSAGDHAGGRYGRDLACEVVILTRDGRTVRGRFHGDDAILYPRSNRDLTGADYPARVGDVFHVRYLADDPDAFVILTDDQSAWASARRCRRLAQDVWRASISTSADRSRPEQRPAYVAAVAAYLSGGCGGEGRDLQALRRTRTVASDSLS
jgi:hypothetical protein